MLRHRLFFGTLMTILFTVVAVFDGWLDGSLTFSELDDETIQGTLLCILIVILMIPAHLEFSDLASAKNLKIFVPFSAIASVLIATAWYWPQLGGVFLLDIYIYLLFGFIFLGLFLYQYLSGGTNQVFANCGVNLLAIVYLGLFSGLILAMRIDFGLWSLLMLIFTVKSADIGAYTAGSLFGKHKFSPNISPGKTWEGMAGAVVLAVIVAVLFAEICDIMAWQIAVLFGVCFAFIGQFGDLIESMMKRDAQQKDSSSHVPGFGGLLDVIDSPLAAAPFAYLFFMFTLG